MKKKIFGVLFAAMLVFGMVGAVNAGCVGPDCSGQGNFDIDVFAAGGGVDTDFVTGNGGYAGGISGAGGVAGGSANGTVWNADAYGDLGVTAGGLTDTYNGTYDPTSGADYSNGLASMSFSQAETTGNGVVGVDTGWAAGTSMSLYGLAAQGSANCAGIHGYNHPAARTTGGSHGEVAQGSAGGFLGAGFATSGFGGDAAAAMGAEIFMNGSTFVGSYRYADLNNGVQTEGMGTNLAATTNLTSSKYTATEGCLAGAGIGGGWVAGGAGQSVTQQVANGGIALSTANGSYSGAGGLGCNYNGYLNGGTHTSITTVDGMNGSIVRSDASMSVGSRVSYGN